MKAELREMYPHFDLKKKTQLSHWVKHWCSSNTEKTNSPADTWGCGIHFHNQRPQDILETADCLFPAATTLPCRTIIYQQDGAPCAPANPNTYSHACWQRYYHLKITVLLLLLTHCVITTGNTSLQILSLSISLSLTPASATSQQKQEKEGRGLHQKEPLALIDMHQMSSYRLLLLLLLLHWRCGGGAGRHRAIAQRHRWKAHSSFYDPAPLLSLRKTEQSCTLN